MEKKRNSLLLIFMCFLAYSISYIGKYSYSTNIQNVITQFDVTKIQAGYVSSAFFFCYGAGQLINGLLSEKLDSKSMISIALIVAGLITFAMYFLEKIFIMTVLWGLNGLVMSVLWCHCIKLLATIREEKYMLLSIKVIALSLPAGIVSAYGCSALFTFFGAWQAYYLFAAALMLVIGVFFYFVVGAIEKQNAIEESGQEKPLNKEQGGENIFRVFGLGAVCIFLIGICTGLIRDGSSTWMPVLLSEIFQTPDYFSILFTLGLPLMGVATASISAYLMKLTNNMMKTAFIAGALAVCAMLVLTLAFDLSVVLLILLFMLLSLAVYILGNLLTSVLPLFYKGRLKSGQTAGIVNAFIYAGSTISTVALGGLVDDWGWSAFMVFLLVCSLIVVISALIGLKIIKKKEIAENRKGE